MASYQGYKTDGKGNIISPTKTDAEIQKEAASLVNPIYQQGAVNQVATGAANAASQTALQAGAENTFATSRDSLNRAYQAESARQSADLTQRGVSLNAANRANETGAGQAKSLLNLTEDEKRRMASISRQFKENQRQMAEATKNNETERKNMLITQANAIKQQGQDIFTKINQFNYQQAHKGGGGGGGGTDYNLKFAPMDALTPELGKTSHGAYRVTGFDTFLKSKTNPYGLVYDKKSKRYLQQSTQDPSLFYTLGGR
jgi:hypothetical protein